jgi:hypothetical protein
MTRSLEPKTQGNLPSNGFNAPGVREATSVPPGARGLGCIMKIKIRSRRSLMEPALVIFQARCSEPECITLLLCDLDHGRLCDRSRYHIKSIHLKIPVR